MPLWRELRNKFHVLIIVQRREKEKGEREREKFNEENIW